MSTLLVYSGGMDSTVALHVFRPDMALTFFYGQRHRVEVQMAWENCKELGITYRMVSVDGALKDFRSALLGHSGIPEGHYTDSSMKATVVPFRNGIFLALAVGTAENEGIGEVMIANHAGDHAIYPDCRPEFIHAMSWAASAGTYNKVMITSPFCNMTKREIALVGRQNGVDFSKTWSCYQGGEIHCGKCGTCVERKEALEGFDPTEYETS